MRVGEAMEIGRLAGLWRYPVKAMAGEPLHATDVSWNGVAGDRRWGIVRDDAAHSGFPWLTLREAAVLTAHRPRLVDATRPDASPVEVTTPSGETYDIADPRLLAPLGAGLHVVKHHRGVFDAAPLSLLTTQSLDRLGEVVGAALDVRRFRPNLVVAAGERDGAAFPEDGWLGCVLRIGGLRLRVDRPDTRCAVIGVDPATGDRDPAVLRAVAQAHDACAGVYATTVAPGRVAIGDAVLLEA